MQLELQGLADPLVPGYSCTALVTIYSVATGNNTDTEIFFDAWQDPYQTTGVLSLQVELEDSQVEDVDVNMLSYKMTISNHFYKYLQWTSTYAIDALVSGCSHQLCPQCCFMRLQGNMASTTSAYCAIQKANPLHYCSLLESKANKAACQRSSMICLHMHCCHKQHK